MSLNRYEQLLHDYLESSPEEKRHWQSRVGGLVRLGGRREELVLILNSELWDYFEERAPYERSFTDAFAGGNQKISMLNLAEYLLRVWEPSKPAARASKRY